MWTNRSYVNQSYPVELVQSESRKSSQCAEPFPIDLGLVRCDPHQHLLKADFDSIKPFSFQRRKQAAVDFTPTSTKERWMYTDFDIMEPNPIGPNGIDIVDQVSLNSASLSKETSLASLHTLCSLILNTNTKSNIKQLQTTAMRRSLMKHNVRRFEQNALNGIRNEVFDLSIMSETSSDSSINTSSTITSSPDRPTQSDQWNRKYRDLEDFWRKYQHCHVPNNWKQNEPLAHWVRRQRHQYRLKMEGKHSTVSDDRRMALEKLGFVWDSHAAVWGERYQELYEFKAIHGHCKVPRSFPSNPQLAIWVKCQRRQFKFYGTGERTSMTPERLARLCNLGFLWNAKSSKVSN
jgi:hypothetical protein